MPDTQKGFGRLDLNASVDSDVPGVVVDRIPFMQAGDSYTCDFIIVDTNVTQSPPLASISDVDDNVTEIRESEAAASLPSPPTHSNATNYNPHATIDDGSCPQPPPPPLAPAPPVGDFPGASKHPRSPHTCHVSYTSSTFM